MKTSWSVERKPLSGKASRRGLPSPSCFFKSWTDESSPTSRRRGVLVLLPLLFRFALILMRGVCCELCRSFTLAM